MNDPYVYKGTSILINNLHIKNEKQLDKAESDFLSKKYPLQTSKAC